MATTYTSSQVASGVQPRAHHVGVNYVTAVYSLTATLTAGDIIQMCKVPDGAKVIACEVISNVNPFAMAGIFDVGTRADQDQFIKSATLSANLRFGISNQAGFGASLSLADDTSTRSTVVEIKVTTSGTGTKSGAISLSIGYVMDDPY